MSGMDLSTFLYNYSTNVNISAYEKCPFGSFLRGNVLRNFIIFILFSFSSFIERQVYIFIKRRGILVNSSKF